MKKENESAEELEKFRAREDADAEENEKHLKMVKELRERMSKKRMRKVEEEEEETSDAQTPLEEDLKDGAVVVMRFVLGPGVTEIVVPTGSVALAVLWVETMVPVPMELITKMSLAQPGVAIPRHALNIEAVLWMLGNTDPKVAPPVVRAVLCTETGRVQPASTMEKVDYIGSLTQKNAPHELHFFILRDETPVEEDVSADVSAGERIIKP